MLAIDYIRPARSVCKFLDHGIPRVTAFLRDLHEPVLGEQPTELLELVHQIMARQDLDIQEHINELYHRGDPFVHDWNAELGWYALVGNNPQSTLNPIEEVSRHSFEIL